MKRDGVLHHRAVALSKDAGDRPTRILAEMELDPLWLQQAGMDIGTSAAMPVRDVSFPAKCMACSLVKVAE